ncbi:hypothetical protein L3Y34_010293 [Caenorhabditis briggsae]|uniref:Phosphatidylinositol-glycan biosynthesis class X protein n=1 Tax=Caenorhabditis briggsae TaxID=6238 RepID=A0AAE8ZL85_CAEBR|nr:hypothetical protein L3Y34_010293 [Caenorhabditis briggsae]
MMYLVFLWCIVLVSADDQSCRLISNKPHGELNIYGNGLHRQIELTAAIQAKTRVPQCRLVYKVMIPERAYVDEREMQSSNPGYDFVVLFSKSSNIQILYIVKKKLYLSTFEIKDTVSWKVHLQPPSNLYPRTLTFKTPNVAVDCNGEFANCIALKMHNDIRLKPTSRQWLHVQSPFSTPIRINIFRNEKLNQDLSFLTCPILIATLSLTIFHLIYKI